MCHRPPRCGLLGANMPIRVFHLDDRALLGDDPTALPPPLFMSAKMGFRSDASQADACRELFHLGLYKLAATVDATQIEDAWGLTNHIERDWTLNPECQAQPGGQRSSSVGDLFEDASGAFHLCASIGFKPIDLGPAPHKSPPPPKAPPKF